jgi:uridylate kinase
VIIVNPVRYRRTLIKLSGRVLSGEGGYGFDSSVVASVAQQIGRVAKSGVEVAVVVGGGNILRGAAASAAGMNRVTADYIGMLGTVINSLVLQDALEKEGIDARIQSAVAVPAIVEPYVQRRAVHHLAKERVVIFAGGTGNPYLTTDTAAALRAVEVGAEVLLVGKHGVDGIYDTDPRKKAETKKFDRITYAEALKMRLEVMDSTAFTLCMENRLPIIVFDLQAPNGIERALSGEAIGTLVCDTRGSS